jgi:hypothetical protein
MEREELSGELVCHDEENVRLCGGHMALYIGRMRAFLIAAIRFYQLTLSGFIGRRCRYLPTCSEYTSDAIAKHGAWRGLLLGLARVSRCHPWGGEGFDPVPEVYQAFEGRQKKRGP